MSTENPDGLDVPAELTRLRKINSELVRAHNSLLIALSRMEDAERESREALEKVQRLTTMPDLRRAIEALVIYRNGAQHKPGTPFHERQRGEVVALGWVLNLIDGQEL